MEIKLSHTGVVVDDQEIALGFYRDVLSFEVVNDVKFEGMRWVTVSPPTQRDIEIILTTPTEATHASPADRQAVTDLLAKGILGSLNFRVDDVDDVFEHIRKSGADVLQEPIDQPYGVRDCAFRDPAGNMVRFSRPLSQ
jgi:catechol 2,3-dioxygenase-like lactoylglutathione lyase family enzyme